MSRVQKSSRVEVEVDASVEQVWDVISDVTRIGEWSHECHSARWLGNAQGPLPGARFRGRNRSGWARWSRISEIVTVDPPCEIVWRTVPTRLFPDSTQWRIRLEPREGRTLITQSFTVVRAPWLLDLLYARLIPAHQDRDARLAEDLARVGAAARPRERT
ncbi:MAG TPA: SRPBCC family protein [Nocardioides sp.]|uniref:SRPBCC family protein n=1 Tax=Nocardioides sp. TaxID=35761 RepID=UPI002CA34F0D|nr:SRPBCC family protein [Nocardioides sp.]HQR25479.1 SRPBCC family protein [Nocardioides sp.]